MKKQLFLLVVAVVFISPVNLISQDCDLYFSMDEGSIMKMVHYDKKGKTTGSSELTINEKKKIPGGVAVQMSQTYVDDKENVFSSKMAVECIDGIIYFDMQEFLDPNSMMAYDEMEIDISADKLPLPANAKPGDRLEDGVITMVIRKEDVKVITIVVEIFDREVVAKENIETPAGTFDCMKIKYNITSKFGFVKINMSTIEWFNKDIGTVRSESYNKKGKLTGYSVLEEIL